MSQFVIHGGKPLNGIVRVGGSKNAALPILAATLLTDQKCVLKNIPNIEDVRNMLEILRSLGSKVEFRNHTVEIQTQKIRQGRVPKELGCRMRASILLLGPLLAKTGFAHLPYPGGCVLGARPIDTHIDVLSKLGITKMASRSDEIIFKGKSRCAEVILPEFSVTATENAIMAAARTCGETVIRLAALEPHVQDLCNFLEELGVDIRGIGTHNLRIRGKKNLHGARYAVAPDYLEAGSLIIASVLTRGNVLVKNVVHRDLDALWNLFKEMKVNFAFEKNAVRIRPTKKWYGCKRLQTNVFPGFSTDLQPPFTILLTQAEGQSYIHEALFENRFAYFSDLIKMGANLKKINQHEAVVKGPAKLHGAQVKSWDIRAGAAMILAALTAKGKTVIKDIRYIDRGYEGFDEKLRKLGAEIERLTTDNLQPIIG
ncbi:UDP-N-acetylglucosamine 1-carboxyvinyltransferase [Candidatus Peregrinibacteria bacterium]|nr:UDP-N-acetylglucosamine 1-carboxyvinyltransferase [Candidatus Peregrinibacteria bacterium]